MKCYKNGALFYSQNRNSTFSNTQLKDLLIVGGLGVGSSFLWFAGSLDDIKIYKRFLIQNDVTALYIDSFTCSPCPIAVMSANDTQSVNLNICSLQTTNLSVISTNTVNWYSNSSLSSIVGSGANFITPTLSAGTYSYFAIANSGCQSAHLFLT